MNYLKRFLNWSKDRSIMNIKSAKTVLLILTLILVSVLVYIYHGPSRTPQQQASSNSKPRLNLGGRSGRWYNPSRNSKPKLDRRRAKKLDSPSSWTSAGSKLGQGRPNTPWSWLSTRSKLKPKLELLVSGKQDSPLSWIGTNSEQKPDPRVSEEHDTPLPRIGTHSKQKPDSPMPKDPDVPLSWICTDAKQKHDPRVCGKQIEHPDVDIYEDGRPVYFDKQFFKDDNQATPPHSTCSKDVPKIDPYEAGGPNGEYSGGLYPDCAKIHMSRSRKLPIVALAMAPGSGNAWVRHLIQQLTGVYTGSVYNHRDMIKEGFHGEHYTNSSVVAVKTHEHWNCSLVIQPPEDGPVEPLPCPRYLKAILVVRDPHQTILSEVNRYYTGGNRRRSVDESFFHSGWWPKVALILAKRWFQTAEVWTRFGNYKDLEGCLLVVSYKQLQAQLQQELIRIGNFLGVKPKYLKKDSKHLDCIEQNSEGSFKRSYTSKLSFDVFDRKMNKTIDIYKERVNDILEYLDAGFTV